jgi:hypothetical protein
MFLHLYYVILKHKDVSCSAMSFKEYVKSSKWMVKWRGDQMSKFFKIEGSKLRKNNRGPKSCIL